MRNLASTCLVVAASIAAAAGLVLVMAAASPSSTPATTTAAVRLYGWGAYEPRGVVLSGLQAYLFGPSNVAMMSRQTWAVRHPWHGNTVGLQAIQDKLVGQGGHNFRPAYFAFIRQVVARALRQGLRVVINAQTEQSVGFSNSEPLPTYATHAFWRVMLSAYANNPRVAFDLFNEPRHCTWDQWRAAMQPLVNEIRGAHADNWIWAEGKHWATTLQGVPMLADPLHRIAYVYHHPAESKGGTEPAPTRAAMDAAFGDLADTGVPVIDGEFANFNGSYAWYHPNRTVPAYFAYLAAHHIALMGWTLMPGSLDRGRRYSVPSAEPQGDGQLVEQLFAGLAGR